MDDLFGGSDDELLGPPIIKTTNTAKSVVYSKLCVPPRVSDLDACSSMMVKMPNFVKLQTVSLDNSSSNRQQEEEQTFPGVSALIRWRNKRDEAGNIIMDAETNKPVRESNARLVKLADGTMQLLVGKEAFKVGLHPLEHNYTYSHETSAPTFDASVDPSLNSNYDKVTVAQTTCLECVQELENYMKIEPISLTSAAHVRTSLKVTDKYYKPKRVVVRPFSSIEENPELDLKLRVQLEEREARADRKQRKEQQEREFRESGGYYRRPKGVGMNARFLEEDAGGFDSVSVAELKKPKPAPRSRYEDQEEEEEDRDFDSEDDEDDEEEGDDEMGDFIAADEEEEEGSEDEGDYSSEDDAESMEGIEEEEEQPVSKKEKRSKKDKKHKKHKKERKEERSSSSSSSSHKRSHEESVSQPAAASVPAAVDEAPVKRQKRLLVDSDSD